MCVPGYNEMNLKLLPKIEVFYSSFFFFFQNIFGGSIIAGILIF